MKLDPKVRNLILFIIRWLGGLTIFLTVYTRVTGEYNPLVLVGHFVSLILTWRILLFITRRYLLKNRSIKDEGKWCIIVDDGSFLGSEFANYLAARKMSTYIISTAGESKTKELVDRVWSKFNFKVEAVSHQFGEGKDASFYENLSKSCEKFDKDGGIALLVCNFGIASVSPVLHDDLSVKDVDSILARTVYPFAHIVSTVHAFMVKRRRGSVITFSSALGNHSAPYLSLYSATRAFLMQLTRSLHIESWGTGVAFLAVTPFDVFHKVTESAAATLVHTAVRQVGKQYAWQICGSYASIVLDWAMGYNPFAFDLFRRHMRCRYEGVASRATFATYFTYCVTWIAAPVIFFGVAVALVDSNITTLVHVVSPTRELYIIGLTACLITAWRIVLSVYRRRLLFPRSVTSYGKWAIVTGSTSGIGKDFAAYLAKKGMSILVISRSEAKLVEQKNELLSAYPDVAVEYLSFDFTKSGAVRDEFYDKLNHTCKRLHEDGGIGLLVNNVGTANEYPKRLEEFTFAEIDDMLNCNISSTLLMSRTLLKYMKERKRGAILNISSGSGNHCGPLLALYSSTKIFMTQFSRSLHAECWNAGVDVHVVTPFYIVSNLFKRKSGTIIAPMPIALIRGTLAQLGKKYVWQSHGYWFHGFIGFMSHALWITVARYRKMMFENRARYDERTKKGT